ncbi:MAG: hypothetical protein IH599_09110 [Bacteroidales bacterium]|nr:hypothetical protein [Bacteroidales bacterium]
MLLDITEIFRTMRLLDVIDIILVALLAYEFFRLVKGTSTINIFLGITSIYLLYKLVSYLKMALLRDTGGFHQRWSHCPYRGVSA